MDDWELVPLLDRAYEGSWSFAELLAPHNEHRIFFPRLAMLAVGLWARWDLHLEMFVGLGFLFAMVAALAWDHRASFGSLEHWVPVAWLLLSLRQSENLLWGWQVQFFMCAAAAVASIICLERSRLVAGIGFALVSTLSLGAGLALWPAGAALLWVRQRRRHLLVWVLAGASAMALYLRGVNSGADRTWLLTHPLRAARFFALALGSPFSSRPWVAYTAAAVLGAVAVSVIVAWRRGGLDRERAAPALALALFSAGFVAMVTVGRGSLGDSSALFSRYTTISMLFAVALHRAGAAVHWPRTRRLLGVALVGLGTAAAIGFFDGTYAEARTNGEAGARLQATLLDFRARSDDELQRLYPRASVVRERAAMLERRGLTVFAR